LENDLLEANFNRKNASMTKNASKSNVGGFLILGACLLIAAYPLNINRFCYQDLTFGANRDFIGRALTIEFARGREAQGISELSADAFREAHPDCCKVEEATDSMSFINVLLGLVRTNVFLNYMYRSEDGQHKFEAWYVFDSCGRVLSRLEMKD